jgi:hypothetical protein
MPSGKIGTFHPTILPATSAFLGTNPMDHAITSSLPLIECLLEAADRALYQMKCSGGGGVISAPQIQRRVGRRCATFIQILLARTRPSFATTWLPFVDVVQLRVLSPKKASGSNVTL